MCLLLVISLVRLEMMTRFGMILDLEYSNIRHLILFCGPRILKKKMTFNQNAGKLNYFEVL